MTVPLMLPLAAPAPAPAGDGGWFGVDALFLLTILFVFGTAIVTALFTRWSKDKCLKLLRGDHVTIERGDGATIWGRLAVMSEGVEVEFTSPGVDRAGRRRSSVLVYPDELAGGKTLGLYRWHDQLSSAGQAARLRQVRATFNPGLLRRWWRKVRILVNTLRDAFSKALGLVVGQVAKRPGSRVLSTQSAGVTQIGDTLLAHGVAANAYEPLLERHIGKPVIVDVKRPGDRGTIGFAGYLAEYTAGFVAVLNVEHEAAPIVTLALPRTADDGEASVTDGAPTPDGHPLKAIAKIDAARVIVQNLGTDAMGITLAEREGFEPLRLGVVVLPGAVLRLPARDLGGATLSLARLRRFDLVAPRAAAIVRHAGELLARRGFLDDLGLDELPLIPKKRTA